MEMETNLFNGYIDAYKLTYKELAKRDVNDVCMKANISFNRDEDAFYVKYLNVVYKINSTTGHVSCMNCCEEVSATIKVLLLHYLLHSSNRPLSGNLVSFKDLKSGAAIYYDTFFKRAIAPLVKTFGNCPQDLLGAAAKLNGFKEKYGHASVTISVLPMVPVTYVIWEGDDEIPASGTILFDDSIESYLPAEDIVYAGSLGVYELIRLKQAIPVFDCV